mmetsp:Transcript_79465/g.208678  ORF Transcript_79465/g.208678 Transcript_79465/m.208678 type:complete len:293 (-) Transcript_79465:112-990(-)
MSARMRAATSAVISCAAAPSNVFRETKMRLFWSRLLSITAGDRTKKLSSNAAFALMACEKVALHSCRKMTSASPYCPARIRSVSATLLVESVAHRAAFTPCQEPGPTVFSMCTRTASKMARHKVWSGTLIASSSSVTAGYLARRMGSSMVLGQTDLLPPFAGTATWSTNMNFFQAAHHVWMSGRGAEELLITEGRNTAPPSARVMLLVMRSGMDARRFAPTCLSFRKPRMMRRFEKSSAQALRVSFTPAQPILTISSQSSPMTASERTLPISTSCSGVGSSMKACTSHISVR